MPLNIMLHGGNNNHCITLNTTKSLQKLNLKNKHIRILIWISYKCQCNCLSVLQFAQEWMTCVPSLIWITLLSPTLTLVQIISDTLRTFPSQMLNLLCAPSSGNAIATFSERLILVISSVNNVNAVSNLEINMSGL